MVTQLCHTHIRVRCEMSLQTPLWTLGTQLTVLFWEVIWRWGLAKESGLGPQWQWGSEGCSSALIPVHPSLLQLWWDVTEQPVPHCCSWILPLTTPLPWPSQPHHPEPVWAASRNLHLYFLFSMVRFIRTQPPCSSSHLAHIWTLEFSSSPNSLRQASAGSPCQNARCRKL